MTILHKTLVLDDDDPEQQERAPKKILATQVPKVGDVVEVVGTIKQAEVVMRVGIVLRHMGPVEDEAYAYEVLVGTEKRWYNSSEIVVV